MYSALKAALYVSGSVCPRGFFPPDSAQFQGHFSHKIWQFQFLLYVLFVPLFCPKINYTCYSSCSPFCIAQNYAMADLH